METPKTMYWIGTYEYTSKFFNQNPQYKIGAEIGIAGGEHVKYLLENTGIEKIYGVDPFDADLWNVPVEIDMEQHYQEVISKLSPYKERFEMVRKTSVDGSKNFEDESLDFIFIDAGHEYNDVKTDIESWLPKVKPTGIIMGHDWKSGFPGVENAVIDSFGTKHLVTRGEPVHVWYITKENAIKS